ncbi:MAG TPA: clan AA aspartic protease [Capsulimonadaceae bacterium]|jgi:clan AA aspartic protease
MIIGYMTKRKDPMVSVVVRGPSGTMEVQAIVDTGFTEYLTLPPAVVESLGLPIIDNISVILADGSSVACNVHDARIKWDGDWIGINVQPAETTPLIGLGLLDGYEVRIEVAPDGAVEISSLT